MKMTEHDYIEAHKFSSKHGDKLKKDKICGCFHCLSIYSPAEIDKWIGDENRTESDGHGGSAVDEELTGICPYCGVDAIIGESSGYPITKEFLTEMKEYWFDRS